MPQFTQQTRLFAVNTTLGDNELMLESFSGTESVSDLFHFDLALLSENRRIDFTQAIGKPISWGVYLFEEGKQRWFHGIISRFTQVPSFSRLGRYHAHVVPWMWYLSRTADCRIFQNKSVPDIVEDVFREHSLTDYRKSLSCSYSPREYCVQYRETALNFIMRLLEEEGIFFYFKHEQTKHTLVLGDSGSAWGTCAEQSRFRLERQESGYRRLEDSVFSWGYSREVRPGAYGLDDFNFEKPSTDLTQSVPSQIELGGNKDWEIFDYPGGFMERSAGQTVTTRRMEEEEAACTTIRGEGNGRTMTAGHKFELAEHDRDDQNGQYVLLSASHSGEQGGFESDEAGEAKYANTFTAIPEAVPYRPPRVAPKRLVGGPQTATVVGPAGEEIYTDQYGRVKVAFHWDRRTEGKEQSSCWIRVAQPWAGKNWGAVNIPRIGQEVIVDFLEGDADRPIITGRVYNALEMPPYKLPDKQTITTFKSNSSKGGAGFNEFRFEDAKGDEQIFMHAEKNFDTRVKNDVFETIGRDSHTVIENDRLEHVKNKRQVIVDADEFESYNDRHVTVKGKQAVEVSQTQSVKVSGNVAEDFGASHSEKVGQNYYLKATGIVIEAPMGITLKCGSNSVVIDNMGVTATGNMVVIEGSSLVRINSGPGSPAMSGTPGMLVPPTAPEAAKDADQADPGEVDKMKAEQRNTATGKYGAPALTPFRPATASSSSQSQQSTQQAGAPPAQQPPKHYIEIKLEDTNNNPVPGERYRVKLPDGTVAEGTLDENGYARVEGFDPGQCEVTFPDVDETALSE